MRWKGFIVFEDKQDSGIVAIAEPQSLALSDIPHFPEL